jgi:hypothetical protein
MKGEKYLGAKIQQIDRKNPALIFQLMVRVVVVVVVVIAVLIMLAI